MVKLGNGVKAEDLVHGEGNPVKKGQLVAIKYLARAAGSSDKAFDGTVLFVALGVVSEENLERDSVSGARRGATELRCGG